MSTARLSGRKYMVQKCTPLNNLFLILSEISPAGIPPPGRSRFYILSQKQKPRFAGRWELCFKNQEVSEARNEKLL